MAQRTVPVPEYEMAERVELDPRRSALVIVDMQNDFVKEEGKLVVPTAQATVPAIRRLLESARDRGAMVAYTQDTHLPGDPEFPIWGEHCLLGSWGWEIIDELRPEPGELVIEKRRYDGFYGTNLEYDLRVRGIDTLVIVGTVANICVLHTAGSAALRWFNVVLARDGISALSDFDMEATLRQVHFLYRGIITTSDAVTFKG
ncbi:Peroxyureidoacrylate/ureidoacrylate amidohydrolase RutB [bacterium HR25]|jgi:nicotinamidase-related amidase|nr:Peroxyureidoacrylate/ureidoacrylate amidohydrolase RutB [bacterium HR25]